MGNSIISHVQVWEDVNLSPEQLMPIITEHTQAHMEDLDFNQPEQCCISVMCWLNLQLVIIDRWIMPHKADTFEVLATRTIDVLTLADAKTIPNLWEQIKDNIPTVVQPSGKTYLN